MNSSRRKSSSQPRPINLVQENDGSDCEYPMFHFKITNRAQPIKVLFTIDRQNASMEVDTGLPYHRFLKQCCARQECFCTIVNLCSYIGEAIPVLGSIDTEVRYNGQRACLTLLLVRGTGPSLVRRKWLDCLKINWSDVHCVNKTVLEKILQEYNSVFQDDSSRLQNYNFYQTWSSAMVFKNQISSLCTP